MKSKQKSDQAKFKMIKFTFFVMFLMSFVTRNSCETNPRIILSNQDRQLVTSLINRVTTRIMHRPNIRTPKNFFLKKNSTVNAVELEPQDSETQEEKKKQEPDMQMKNLTRTHLVNMTDEHQEPQRSQENQEPRQSQENQEPQQSQENSEESSSWNFLQQPTFLIAIGIAGFLLVVVSILLTLCLPVPSPRVIRKRPQSTEEV